MAHQDDCACSAAAGPAAWKTLLAASFPTKGAPHSASSSLYVSSTYEQRLVVVDNPASQWWHIRVPRWLLPTTKGEMNGHNGDVESATDISLEAILGGLTKSPVRISDLKGYLREWPSMAGELAAVEFLIAFNRLKTSFLALPPSRRPPHPYTVIEHLSLTETCNYQSPSPITFGNEDEEVTGGDTLPALPSAAVVKAHRRRSTATYATKPRYGSLKPLPARPRASTFTHGDAMPTLSPMVTGSSTLFDPNLQPLRGDLQNLVDRFLTEVHCKALVDLIPINTLNLALSEVNLTTHPSTLEPIANLLNAHLTRTVLPSFLDSAVINLSSTTSMGRMIMAVAAFALGAFLTTIMVLYGTRVNRAARLCLTPLFFIGIGYAIGSKTGLCFWLAWRGTREEKKYEETEKAGKAEMMFRMNAAHSNRGRLSETFSWPWKHRKQRNSSVAFRSSIYTINSSLLYNNEKGHLLPMHSPSSTRASFLQRAFQLRKRVSEGYKNYNSFHPMKPAKKPWNWERVKRMMGTATSTVVVEDERVRRAQTRMAVKVTVWLVIGTMLVMAIVLAIPDYVG